MARAPFFWVRALTDDARFAGRNDGGRPRTHTTPIPQRRGYFSENAVGAVTVTRQDRSRDRTRSGRWRVDRPTARKSPRS